MNPDKALTNQLQQESVTNPTQTLTPPQPSDPALAYQLATAVDKSILEEETPDVHQLFSYFNHTYFNNQLKNVKVKWSSSQMIKRAGSCKSRYVGSRHYCTITLSKPLLKLRPKKDMIETLLHEMIHAVLFITTKRITGHGPRFLSEAKRISEVTGFKIKVFHNFHKEVDFYLTHDFQKYTKITNSHVVVPL
ncbi:SprT-like family-domain-containing protein [Pilaira anomala]|nr:SprT-like family-domain-containing protein [Pilaira anomala]